MTVEERAIQRLMNPKPGGKIWAAKEYGIDLTQLIQRMRETTEHRLATLEAWANDMEELRKAPFVKRNVRV